MQSDEGASKAAASLETLRFDNLSIRALPLDSSLVAGTRQVRGACFSQVPPTKLKNTQLIAASLDALALLDLGEDQVGRSREVEEGTLLCHAMHGLGIR
jgi:hypothetical protein